MAHPPGLPEGKRWRCEACGNLTRFDVESTESVRRFWHFDLGGDATAEEETLVNVTVGAISCRWCGSRDAVRVVDVPGGAGAETAPA